MAQIPGSNISAGVRPNDTQDRYDTHSAEYGRGGYHTGHADIAARDAIPGERRQWYMVVPLLDGAKYELVPGLASQVLTDNNNWRPLAIGAAPSGPVYWGTLASSAADSQTIVGYVAQQLQGYEENWQPFATNEIPSIHAAAAGLQLRPLLQYILRVLGTGGSDSTLAEYEATDYEATDYPV